MAKQRPVDDAAMTRVRKLWAEKQKSAKLTQEDLGISMGYEQSTARQSVNQFLKSHDPRISMLRKFAKAIGVTLAEIVDPKNA